jgi:hypothetical protein
MKNTAKKSVSLLLGVALIGCAPLPEDLDTEGEVGQVSSRIVGGVRAAPGEFPFAVRLTLLNAECGGSLVTSTLVLTAAHCVAGRAPSTITATLGRTRLTDTNGEVRGVSEVIVHPSYNSATHDYDVAFVRLSAPSAQPVVQVASPYGPSHRVLWNPGATATVIGWGYLTENGPSSVDLMKAEVPVVSDATASSATSYGSRFHPNVMVAAGPLTGGRDSCYGDSGGPLMFRTAEGWRQFGVVSWGDGCARPNKPGVYARISDVVLHRWIKSVIHETPLVGDVNGDGRADIVTFTHGGRSDVVVSLSTGASFGPASVWHDWYVQDGVRPLLGDFNGDGRADAWAVTDTNVWVARSTGSNFFGPSYQSAAGTIRPDDVPAVGDVNGDGRADLVLFSANDAGDVDVMLSNGTTLAARRRWHEFFGLRGETLMLADVNGDGRKDILSFTQGIGGGNVWVALSTGTAFGPSSIWNSFFAFTGEMPGVGRFNNGPQEDIVTFTRDSLRDVHVGLSNGSNSFAASPWHGDFGRATSTLLTGDVNGDGRTDLVEFTQDASADVNVSLSTGTSFGAALKWHDYFAP